MDMNIKAELQDIIDLLNGPVSPVDFIVDERNVYEAVESLMDKYNEVNGLLETVQDMIA